MAMWVVIRNRIIIVVNARTQNAHTIYIIERKWICRTWNMEKRESWIFSINFSFGIRENWQFCKKNKCGRLTDEFRFFLCMLKLWLNTIDRHYGHYWTGRFRIRFNNIRYITLRKPLRLTTIFRSERKKGEEKKKQIKNTNQNQQFEINSSSSTNCSSFSFI